MSIEIIPPDRNDNSGIPIFIQISNWILQNIESGAFQPNDRLPTEREVSQKFGVSRGTVKNAFKKLEQEQVIQTIQGSGSYVLNRHGVLEDWHKKEALKLISSTLQKLRKMNLSEKELSNLIHLCLASQDSNRLLNVAIIDNNLEAMLDMKNQLSYLTQISISVFIMESITSSPRAENLFENFDLIIVASPHYKEITTLLPDSKEKVIEVAVSPSQEALIELATLDRNARIGIISRTNVFLITVQETLFSFHFQPENISSFFELEYTVETFFPGGIDALISFSDAHIFTSENFIPRNEALRAKGGKLIRFEYQIERGSLIYIEDKINSLLPEL